ncbi:MAG: pilus assembly protein PilM [bacterium]
MKFLTPQRRIGLDIGSTTIKLVELSLKKKEERLKLLDKIELADEFALMKFEDIKENRVTQTLRSLIEKHKLSNCLVNATLPANACLIRRVPTAKSCPEAAIVTQIRDDVKDCIDGPIENMRVVYQREQTPEDKEQESVLACLVPESIVEKYQKMIEHSKLRLSVLDVDAFGVYNALYRFFGGIPPKVVSALHVGSQYSICCITAPGKHPFFHTIHQGGNDLTHQLMEEGGLGFSKSEAVKKRMFHPDRTGLPAFQKSDLKRIFDDYAQKLLHEIKQVFLYFQSKEGVTKIDLIMLSGGGAQITLFIDSVRNALKIETVAWNPLEMFEGSDHVNGQKKSGQLFTPAIGTLLRGGSTGHSLMTMLNNSVRVHAGHDI